MDTVIHKIYKRNLEILESVFLVVYFFRNQNYDAGLRTSNATLKLIEDSLGQILQNSDYFNQDYNLVSTDLIMSIFNDLLTAQHSRDYVLLADLYEARVYPFIISLQEVIYTREEICFDNQEYLENIEMLKNKDRNLGNLVEAMPNPALLLEKNYSIEYTSTGFKTLALFDNNIKYYLHSNNDIIKEAFALAKFWYANRKSHSYIVYGLGLGYHIIELALLDVNNTIEVYESDINVIQLACAYADNFNKLLQNSNIKLIYDPDCSKIINRVAHINQESDFVIHYPSLRNIKQIYVKEHLENYFVQYSSIRNQYSLLVYNFKRNIQNYDGIIDDLRDKFKGRTVYIVAAGPSLDKNFTKLKEVGNEAIILSTGTVFKKLIKAGITPNYVLVTDANKRVYAQIKDYENCNVPMLFLSTAYYEFSSNYKGLKYIAFQKEFNLAENYAAFKNVCLFNTGGSVSTLALDICIQFECSRIIFLGLDLAYTDDYIHASDTSLRELKSYDGLIQIKDINDKLIYTSKSLNIYRQWIENRIKDIKDIEFIDATEGGAKVNGMKIMKLSECISKFN